MIMMMSCLQDPADGRAKLLRPPQRQRQQTGAAATTAAGATLRINIQLGDQNKLTWRGQYLPDLRPHTWQVGDERRSIPERPFGNTLLQGDNDSPGRNRPADANGDQGGEESIWQNSPDKREQLHLYSNFDGLLSTEGEQTPFRHPNAHDELSELKGSTITKKISSIFARASCCSKRPRAASHHQHCLLLLLVVLAASLTCFHNAQTCSGFGLAEWDHDPGLTGHPNPNVKPDQLDERRLVQSSSPPSPRPSNDNYWDKIMSLTWGRFSQDDSAIAPREQAAPSTWTSLLNPFGPRPPIQQNTGGGGGGGGDDLDNHIKRILVPRVSGTPGNVEVREYIVDELRKNDYHVELDEFTGATPVGKVKFANIIGSSNPNACRQLVLACHYDSKMLDGFLGAVDSAVPCAMLLKMSDTFGKSFRASGEPPGSQADSLGLQFIFFDGEEAFVQWTSTDSLYGSRHLAAKWAKQAAPGGQCGANVKSKLDQIELFVLLDLIGASDSSFVMYNAQLRHHYEALQRYEKAALAALTHLNQLQKRRATAFKSQTLPANFVEDDHVPFMKRNVPILLLLAHPFPKVWHTIDDNYEAIDFPKTRRVLHVLEEFVANYQPSRRP